MSRVVMVRGADVQVGDLIRSYDASTTIRVATFGRLPAGARIAYDGMGRGLALRPDAKVRLLERAEAPVPAGVA